MTGETNYYKKCGDVPALPEGIKLACIDAVNQCLSNPPGAWYRSYETENLNSIAYIKDIAELSETAEHISGGVGFYEIPAELHTQIVNFYKEVNHPVTKDMNYHFQVVTGGSFVAPHIDVSSVRSSGFIYLLVAGGNDVKTVWYEPTDQNKHLELTQAAGIPYSRLTVVETHCLEEDSWHWLNFSKIHSVENQESLRIAIWGY